MFACCYSTRVVDCVEPTPVVAPEIRHPVPPSPPQTQRNVLDIRVAEDSDPVPPPQ